MSDIVLSAGVRSNLLQLQQPADLITSTQTKLATGKRVNSALDNPINFFTAQGLTVRANDLNSLLDAMSTGINTIQAANNVITAITKLVQSAQSLVSQAQQTSDTNVRATLASQFDNDASSVQQARAALKKLQEQRPADSAVELGAALRELRNLRAVHALAPASARSAAKPAVPAARRGGAQP